VTKSFLLLCLGVVMCGAQTKPSVYTEKKKERLA
jgi:hypothetical protein